MRRLRKRSKRLNQKIILGAFFGVMFLAVVVLICFLRPPEDVLRPFLIAQVLDPAKCAGDAWGLDLYLFKKSDELMNKPGRDIQTIMMARFAGAIIASAPWDRSIDDIKYSYDIAKQRKKRFFSGVEDLFVKAQTVYLNNINKNAVVNAEEIKTLKTLREKERTGPRVIAEAQYRSMLGKKGSDTIKAKMLARIVWFESTNPGNWPQSKIRMLKQYNKENKLPAGEILFLKELEKNTVLNQRGINTRLFIDLAKKQNEVLMQYDQAITSLSANDYKDFIEQAEKLVRKYPNKSFAPALSYQIWSVLNFDLKDFQTAADRLVRLKEEYPLSPLSHPETAMSVYLPVPREAKTMQTEVFEEKIPMEIEGLRPVGPEDLKAVEPQTKPQGTLDAMTIPFNFVRGFVQGVWTGLFLKMGRFASGLEPNKIYDQVVDNSQAREFLDRFMPPFAMKAINRYDVRFENGGVVLSMELNMGFSYLKVVSRGGMVVRGGEGTRRLELDMREMKVQGMQVPPILLRQIESGFNDSVRSSNLPLEMMDIQYWQGGARVVFRRK